MRISNKMLLLWRVYTLIMLNIFENERKDLEEKTINSSKLSIFLTETPKKNENHAFSDNLK